MAFTKASWDNAEWTVCRENSGPAFRVLPWAFMRLGDKGEERQYVVPIRHGSSWMAGTPAPGIDTPKWVGEEFMPFVPFPVEGVGRAPRVNGDAPNKYGPVHFFGWI